MIGKPKVYKYQLRFEGATVLDLPFASEVIHVHAQNDVPTIWVLNRESTQRTERRFQVYATGVDIGPHCEHIGTVHIGWTVWHVFEVMPHTRDAADTA